MWIKMQRNRLNHVGHCRRVLLSLETEFGATHFVTFEFDDVPVVSGKNKTNGSC